MNFFFFIIFFIQHVAASSHSYSSIKDSYETWCVGSCTTDVTTSTTPGAVLMGGGTDTDEAFEWQIKNVNGGDFVILRASGDDAYNDYVYDLSVASGNKLNSVTTILFKNGDASSESYVLTLIENAEAIFFAGGDQYEYLSYWRDTDVQRIIQNKLQNITIGGTSAGLAVLGNWVYSAEEGSVYSDEALEDPYNKYITIVPALLHIPFMETIITDTHFKTRDRMGRMLTFVARILEDDNNSTVARGVGVDEHTALLLDTLTGDVKTVGVSTAYVCSADHDPKVCSSGKPLTFQDVACTRLSGIQQDQYSFRTFKSRNAGGLDYENIITYGHFTTLPYGPVTSLN